MAREIADQFSHNFLDQSQININRISGDDIADHDSYFFVNAGTMFDIYYVIQRRAARESPQQALRKRSWIEIESLEEVLSR